MVLTRVQLHVSKEEERLEYRLSSDDQTLGLRFQKLGGVKFEQSARRYFERYLRELEGLDPSDGALWHAQTRVRSQGQKLYRDLIPEKLDRRLRPLLDRVASLQVYSEDVSIPWELLCFPARSSDPGTMWAEAFQVCRMPPDIDKVSRRIDIGKIAWVVGDGSLPSVADERGAIEEIVDGRWPIVEVPSRYQDVVETMGSGEFGLWHFVGHGSAEGEDADSFRLVLDDHNLKPGDLQASAAGIEMSAPLVFFNACQVGRSGYGLTGVGGWGNEFLSLGASAFVGPLWSVRDSRAALFAKAFYRRLLAGETVGAAVQHARKQLRNDRPGDPTWLAYTAFADGSAALMETSSSGGQSKVESPDSIEVGPHVEGAVPELEIEESATPLQVQKEERERKPPPAKRQSGTRRRRIKPIHREVGRMHRDLSQLLPVPGGSYPMGTDDPDLPEECGPCHLVRLSPFWIAKFPVTNRQYERFLSKNPGYPTPEFWNDAKFNEPDQPVVGVDWHDACAYCTWAGLDLPTEAQWEAAARGQDGFLFPWGNDEPEEHHANFGGRVGKTTPVAHYSAGLGPFGTLDQAGNVWEWCLDAWDPLAYRSRGALPVDPVHEEGGLMRVVRGGSWVNHWFDARADFRGGSSSKLSQNQLGFRCVWNPPAGS